MPSVTLTDRQLLGFAFLRRRVADNSTACAKGIDQQQCVYKSLMQKACISGKLSEIVLDSSGKLSEIVLDSSGKLSEIVLDSSGKLSLLI